MKIINNCRKTGLRLTALVLSLFIVVEPCVMAAPSVSMPATAKLLNSEVEADILAGIIEIPESLGLVSERHISSSALGPALIHIQDAHSSFEAQNNIQKILHHLYDQYSVDFVFVEGAVSRMDAKFLRLSEDNKFNKELASWLAKEGVVSGAELYLLDQELDKKKVKMFGVEALALYEKNLESFKSVYADKETVASKLPKMKALIAKHASRTFNKKLKIFFRDWLFYQDAKGELLKHMNDLKRYAAQELGLDFNNPRLQLEWPQLARFHGIQKIESEISLPKAKEEHVNLLNWMSKNNIDEICRREIGLYVPGSGIAQKKGSFRALLEKFYENAKDKGFTFEAFPQISMDFARSILREEIRAEDLFSEINQLTQNLLAHLAITSEEKEIIALYQDYILLQKMLSLVLTQPEYLQIKNRQSEVAPSAMIERIQRFEAGASRKAKGELLDARSLDVTFNKAHNFYEEALERDRVIFSQALEKMKTEKKSIGVLITGGFHAPGLQEEITEQGMSYVGIMPQINDLSGEGQKIYENVMNLTLDTTTKRSYISAPRVATDDVLRNVMPDYTSLLNQLIKLGLDNAPAIAMSEVRTVEKSKEIAPKAWLDGNTLKIEDNSGIYEFNFDVSKGIRPDGESEDKYLVMGVTYDKHKNVPPGYTWEQYELLIQRIRELSLFLKNHYGILGLNGKTIAPQIMISRRIASAINFGDPVITQAVMSAFLETSDVRVYRSAEGLMLSVGDAEPINMFSGLNTPAEAKPTEAFAGFLQKHGMLIHKDYLGIPMVRVVSKTPSAGIDFTKLESVVKGLSKVLPRRSEVRALKSIQRSLTREQLEKRNLMTVDLLSGIDEVPEQIGSLVAGTQNDSLEDIISQLAMEQTQQTKGEALLINNSRVSPDGHYRVVYPDGALKAFKDDIQIGQLIVNAPQARTHDFSVTNKGVYYIGDQRSNLYMQFVSWDNFANPQLLSRNVYSEIQQKFNITAYPGSVRLNVTSNPAVAEIQDFRHGLIKRYINMETMTEIYPEVAASDEFTPSTELPFAASGENVRTVGINLSGERAAGNMVYVDQRGYDQGVLVSTDKYETSGIETQDVSSVTQFTFNVLSTAPSGKIRIEVISRNPETGDQNSYSIIAAGLEPNKLKSITVPAATFTSLGVDLRHFLGVAYVNFNEEPADILAYARSSAAPVYANQGGVFAVTIRDSIFIRQEREGLTGNYLGGIGLGVKDYQNNFYPGNLPISAEILTTNADASHGFILIHQQDGGTSGVVYETKNNGNKIAAIEFASVGLTAEGITQFGPQKFVGQTRNNFAGVYEISTGTHLTDYKVSESNSKFVYRSYRAGDTAQRPGSNVQIYETINVLTGEERQAGTVDHPNSFDISPDGKYAVAGFYVPSDAQTPFEHRTGVQLISLETGESTHISVPEGQRVEGVKFVSSDRIQIRVFNRPLITHTIAEETEDDYLTVAEVIARANEKVGIFIDTKYDAASFENVIKAIKDIETALRRNALDASFDANKDGVVNSNDILALMNYAYTFYASQTQAFVEQVTNLSLSDYIQTWDVLQYYVGPQSPRLRADQPKLEVYFPDTFDTWFLQSIISQTPVVNAIEVDFAGATARNLNQTYKAGDTVVLNIKHSGFPSATVINPDLYFVTYETYGPSGRGVRQTRYSIPKEDYKLQNGVFAWKIPDTFKNGGTFTLQILFSNIYTPYFVNITVQSTPSVELQNQNRPDNGVENSGELSDLIGLLAEDQEARAKSEVRAQTDDVALKAYIVQSGVTVQSVAEVMKASANIASIEYPRSIVEALLNSVSPETAPGYQNPVRMKAMEAAREAMGEYAWMIESKNPAHLAIPVSAQNINAQDLAALSILFSQGDLLRLVVPGISDAEAKQISESAAKEALKIGNSEFARTISLSSSGSSVKEIADVLKRVASGKNFTAAHSAILDTRRDVLESVGVTGSARLLSPAHVDKEIVVVVTAALLRQQMPETYTVQDLEKWLSENKIDIRDVAQRVSQMIQAVKRIAAAA